MSSGLLVFIAAVYVYVAAEQALLHRWGMALAWTAYAIANLGLALDMRKP